MFTYFVYCSTQILGSFPSEELAIKECSEYNLPDVNYIALSNSLVSSHLLNLIDSLKD